MPQHSPPWQSNPDIRLLLSELLDSIRDILQDQLRGFYLSGSLALGDFNEATSDIDFLVVTRAALTAGQVQALTALHAALYASGRPWTHELEGAYIPQPALRRHRDPPDLCPHLGHGSGELHDEPLGESWVIHRHVLRQCGVVLCGPPPATLIDPVTPDDLRRATRGLLCGWWREIVDHRRGLLEPPAYRGYAVQTMCRVLYTLEHGTIVSKPAAAAWAVAVLAEPWPGLIRRSFGGSPSESNCSMEDCMAFIRFALRQCE